MIDASELEEVVARAGPQFSECASQWREQFHANQLRLLGAGEGTAAALHATFSVRHKTTQAGGIPSCGFSATLDELSRLPRSTLVVTYAYKGESGPLFVLFVAGETRCLVGCVSVQRGELPPTLEERGLTSALKFP